MVLLTRNVPRTEYVVHKVLGTVDRDVLAIAENDAERPLVWGTNVANL